MSEYDLDPSIRAAARRKIFRVSVPLALAAVGVGVGIGATQGGASLEFLAVIAPVMALFVGLSLYRAYRRQLRQIESYRLFISPEEIRREITGLPVLSIHREDVRAIELHPSGAITVKTERAAQLLLIPAEIRNRDVLLRELSEWRTPQPVSASPSSFKAIVTALAVLAGFAVTMLSRTPSIVIAVGSALALALAISCVLIWRHKQLSASTRRRAFFALLPLAAIVVRVIAAFQQL